MSGVVITKVEILPQTMKCKENFLISVCAFQITNGAGDRSLPFRLKSDDPVVINSDK